MSKQYGIVFNPYLNIFYLNNHGNLLVNSDQIIKDSKDLSEIVDSIIADHGIHKRKIELTVGIPDYVFKPHVNKLCQNCKGEIKIYYKVQPDVEQWFRDNPPVVTK